MPEVHNSDSQPGDLDDMSLRMRYLFATVRKSDNTGYTVDEVARGTGVSLTYLRNMLAGRQDNPSRKVIAAIARFFRVSPAYFFDSDCESNSEGEAPASEIEVALRSAERLGPEGRQILLDMIRLTQRIVGQRSTDT